MFTHTGASPSLGTFHVSLMLPLHQSIINDISVCNCDAHTEMCKRHVFHVTTDFNQNQWLPNKREVSWGSSVQHGDEKMEQCNARHELRTHFVFVSVNKSRQGTKVRLTYCTDLVAC